MSYKNDANSDNCVHYDGDKNVLWQWLGVVWEVKNIFEENEKTCIRACIGSYVLIK